MENYDVIGLDAMDPLIYKLGGITYSKPHPEKYSTARKRIPILIGGKAVHDFCVDEKVSEHLNAQALHWMNTQKNPFFLISETSEVYTSTRKSCIIKHYKSHLVA